MIPLLRIGHVIKGRVGTYTITKHIQETVWFANAANTQETVVIKSVRGHPRVENERDVLGNLQHRTSFLRPMIDEIKDPSLPTTIVLRYLQSDILTETIKRTLNRKELKQVCKSVLEALKVIHGERLVHTDLKPDNVFVDLQNHEDSRFSNVQLGDLGGCYSVNSEWATSGTFVGTPIWASPEVILEMPWNTATDIWSFGTLLVTLIYGDLNMFRPQVPRDHEEYVLQVLMQQFRYFGPFPAKFTEIASEETCETILMLMQLIPDEERTPFSWITEKEVTKKDKDFIGKIMLLDWRDRPTAKELLEDEWWGDEDVTS